jgi:hypothetical protein
VKIVRRGLATPAKSYVAVGKAVIADWLTDKTIPDVEVGAGQRVLLDAQLDAMVAQKDELVHAIFDIETSAPLEISFVSIASNGDAVTATAGLGVLPADVDHQRGTFPNADITVTAAPDAQQKGLTRMRLGGGGIDAPLSGLDRTAASPAPQALAGNYGLLYRIELGSTNARAGISARGGPWGGVARDGVTTVALPSATESLSGTTNAIVLGTLGPTTKLRLMSAGGSALPVDLFLLTP